MAEEGENNGDVSWNVKVLDASKDGEILKFTVQTKTMENDEEEKGVIVLREYDDFEWLYHCLVTHNNIDAVVVPPLPARPLVTATAAESKSKKQLGKNAKNMIGDEFFKDCRNLEKFIQLVLAHPALKNDGDLEKFLTEEQAQTRTKIKKGLFGSLSKTVGEVRYQSHKDINDEFQKLRDFVEKFSLANKECCMNFTKMVNAQQRVGLSLGELSASVSTAAVLDEVSSQNLKRTFTLFSEALTSSKESYEVMSANDENTLGFTMDLYSKYMDSAKDMLFRRTCKLVEFENASKALEKAKPQKKDQCVQAKKEAEDAYTEITDLASTEMSRFNRQRVLSLQSAMVQYAESRIKNGRDTYAVLLKLLNYVKKADHS
ncbi:sorting nexin-5 [Nematostella vectensis]|uniref:sorting nexin-5 n=1 Tax=Nematostella vectensis TaxID=45351 RepID=UPI002077061E|nr:sorting nexin-5 [Nematostella vectensis]